MLVEETKSLGGTRRMRKRRINQVTFTETSWEQEGYESIHQNFCSFTFLRTNAKVAIVFTSCMHFLPQSCSCIKWQCMKLPIAHVLTLWSDLYCA